VNNNKTLRIARLTLKEAMSRRLIPAGVVVSLLYVALFALAYNFAQDRGAQLVTGQRSRVLVGIGMASLTLSGLYIVNLLSGFLALFLSVGAVSAEVDSGTLHALLARPVRRWQFLLGRWLAYALIISVYVAVMAGLVLTVAAVIGDYTTPDAARAIGLMILASLFLVTLSLFGSTFLPTSTNGAVVFTLFGLGWLSGVIQVLGETLGNPALLNLGVTVALFIPSDMLWRSASYYVQPASLLAAANAFKGALPILANAPPTPGLIAWGVVYSLLLLGTATVVFSRRDL
jgi:ABC-type transport system involved in multi-copper enzyme maturation permease subunit